MPDAGVSDPEADDGARSWGVVGAELAASAPPGQMPDFDGIRARYLAELSALTGRDVIVYATDWLSGSAPAGADISINFGDIQGFMEVFRDLEGPTLDLILLSPGGSAEAAARLLSYLRTRYTHIRAVVPIAAMSAATMLALGANEILMGKHSHLGPIDPQMSTPRGFAPARAVLDQFQLAQDQIKDDPSLVAAWLPILEQYGPALLKQCEAAEALGRMLVSQWLEAYMFAGEPDAAARAEQVAAHFADHRLHRSHARAIDREEARSAGVTIVDLEDDQVLQNAVLAAHHAIMHTFSSTPATKIIENQLGRRYVRITQVMQMQMQMAPAPAS